MGTHTQKMRFLICLFFVCCRFALAKNATTTTSARECTFYLIDPELDQFDENSRWRGGKHLREGSKKSFKYDLFDFSEQDLTWNGTTIHLIAKNPTKDSASWVAGVVGNKTHKKQKFAEADIVLFNLDHHTKPFIVPQKISENQMFAVTGHAPTSLRPSLWHDKKFTSLFDFTIHWADGSDVPLYFYDDEYGLQRNSTSVPKFWDSYDFVRHKQNYSKSDLVSTLFFDCSGDRVEVAKSLQPLVNTINYGPCMHNVAEKHTSLWRHPERKKALLGRNKFHLAWETTVEPGWITDPIFDALRAGAVPIYRGDPNLLSRVPHNSVIYLDKLLPNNESFVEELANLIQSLAKNHTAYFEYHKWRDDPQSYQAFASNLRGNRFSAFHRACSFYLDNKDMLAKRSSLSFSTHRGWHSSLLQTSQFQHKQKARQQYAAKLAQDDAKLVDAAIDEKVHGRDMGFLLLLGFLAVCMGRMLYTCWFPEQRPVA